MASKKATKKAKKPKALEHTRPPIIRIKPW
jgi:hypothetical protein